MITVSVKDYNQISQDSYDSVINSLPFHQLKCSCGHSACLTIHGYYTRKLFLPEGIISIRICRVKCSECGRTHALILSSMVPYCRFPLSIQLRIILAYTAEVRRKAICQLIPAIDENSVKSVFARYRSYWRQRLQSEGIRLSPVPDLVEKCFSFYSRQFMQIRGTPNLLFSDTT